MLCRQKPVSLFAPLFILTAAMSMAEAGPSITRIDGATDTNAGITSGLVDMDVGKTWNTFRVVNDQAGVYMWTIRGSGFGSTPGAVTLAGRSVPIASGGWSDTAIKVNPTGAQINPTQHSIWYPISTTLRVRTASGAVAESGASVVPAIRTRIYGQCTHYVAQRRLEMERQPSPTAYSGYTAIGSSWVPSRGDQLQWTLTGGGRHCGIVESVSGPTVSGNLVTYQVTISQRNAAGRNEDSRVTSPFSFRTDGTVLKRPVFTSGGTNQATAYYR